MHIYNLAFLLFFQSFVACNQVSENSRPSPANLVFNSIAATQQQPEETQPGAANLVFQSADGGQTWQDISAGLPADLQAEGFFAGNGELYLRADHRLYRNRTASTAPVWEKEVLPGNRSPTVFPGGVPGYLPTATKAVFIKK